MYLYISSDQGQEYFPENNSSSFKVKLPKTLYFPKNQSWFISLMDIQVPKLKDPTVPYVLITSSVCDTSIVEQGFKPVLHKIYPSQISKGKPIIPSSEHSVPLTVDHLSVLDVNIISPTGDIVAFRPGHSYMTLRITPQNDN